MCKNILKFVNFLWCFHFPSIYIHGSVRTELSSTSSLNASQNMGQVGQFVVLCNIYVFLLQYVYFVTACTYVSYKVKSLFIDQFFSCLQIFEVKILKFLDNKSHSLLLKSLSLDPQSPTGPKPTRNRTRTRN